MKSWDERPPEIANLFNPAFCSILLCDSITNYYIVKRQTMPYSLSFLILPIILHEPTCMILPQKAAMRLPTWVKKHPKVRVGFSNRVNQFIPYTKEAIIFGLRSGIITIDEHGKLVGNSNNINSSLLTINEYCGQIDFRSKARLIGRWFARSSDESAIYKTWGIQP